MRRHPQPVRAHVEQPQPYPVGRWPGLGVHGRQHLGQGAPHPCRDGRRGTKRRESPSVRLLEWVYRGCRPARAGHRKGAAPAPARSRAGPAAPRTDRWGRTGRPARAGRPDRESGCRNRNRRTGAPRRAARCPRGREPRHPASPAGLGVRPERRRVGTEAARRRADRVVDVDAQHPARELERRKLARPPAVVLLVVGIRDGKEPARRQASRSRCRPTCSRLTITSMSDIRRVVACGRPRSR